MDLRDVIVRPLVTEKSTALAAKGKYAFSVRTGANKLQIKLAVEQLFKVEVTSVNVASMHGKWRRYGRSRGQRPDWKKAVVTLRAGQSIEMFPGT